MSDEAEKQHEPSQKRLEDARRKGEIPRSQDLNAAAAYGGLLLAVAGLGQTAVEGAGEAAMVLLAQSDRLSTLMAEGGAAPLAGIFTAFGKALFPLLLFPLLAVLAASLAQRSLVFAGEKLAPKASRLSPLAGLRNRFGRSGLFEFAKNLAKLVLVAGVLGIFLLQRSEEILGTAGMAPSISMALLMRMVIDFLMIVLLLSVAIGAADYLWQRQEHLRRHRMSHQEVSDETRSSEGDPQMKTQRRRRGFEIATNRMLRDVPKADVVIVNPTHYAVALKWSRGDRRAPVCLAKGVDGVATQIRERAAETGVPIHRDPPAARALYATVKIGQEIRPEHYRAVAAAIRFAEAMRRKAGARQ